MNDPKPATPIDAEAEAIAILARARAMKRAQLKKANAALMDGLRLTDSEIDAVVDLGDGPISVDEAMDATKPFQVGGLVRQ